MFGQCFGMFGFGRAHWALVAPTCFWMFGSCANMFLDVWKLRQHLSPKKHTSSRNFCGNFFIKFWKIPRESNSKFYEKDTLPREIF
jgi:hypothetical protein